MSCTYSNQKPSRHAQSKPHLLLGGRKILLDEFLDVGVVGSGRRHLRVVVDVGTHVLGLGATVSRKVAHFSAVVALEVSPVCLGLLCLDLHHPLASRWWRRCSPPLLRLLRGPGSTRSLLTRLAPLRLPGSPVVLVDGADELGELAPGGDAVGDSHALLDPCRHGSSSVSNVEVVEVVVLHRPPCLAGQLCKGREERCRVLLTRFPLDVVQPLVRSPGCLWVCKGSLQEVPEVRPSSWHEARCLRVRLVVVISQGGGRSLCHVR